MFRAKLRTLVCKPPVNCSVTHKPLDNKNNGTCYDCYQFVIKRLIEIAETRINTGFFKQLDLFGINDSKYIENILKIVGLSEVGKKKTKHFSLGMKQRLGIGLALVGEPDLLVLDEPINGLDPQGIAEIRDMLLRLKEEQNMTIIISSHILEELSKIATHYGIIHNGSLIQELTREELMTRCSERMELTLDDPKAALPILDQMGFTNYQVVNQSTIHIYERLNESAAVNMELAKAGVLVKGIGITNEELENYFLNLTGGAHNA